MTKLKIIFVVNKLGISGIFSIPILSQIAKNNGHRVDLVEFEPNTKKALKEVLDFGPDIVGYSVCSNEAEHYLEINNYYKSKKELKFFSLFGGPHPTFFPFFIEKDNVDAICRGEGDLCFPIFLKHFNTDKMYETSNFSFKSSSTGFIENPLLSLVEDLDTLPFPDNDIIYSKSYFLANNPVKIFFAGRGCPYKCTYCFNHSYNSIYRKKGKIVRTKSVGYLLSEIKNVRIKYPLYFVRFHDDIFGIDKEWFDEFAERYPKEIGLPFLCYTRPTMVDEDYCHNLKKSGCYSVCIAIECGNEWIRNTILERNMSNEQIKKAFEILRRFGIRTYALNMIGLPHETDKEISQTIRLNQLIKPDFSDASIFQPYPGTKLTQYCKNNGYLDGQFEFFESQYSVSVLNFSPDFKKRIFVYQRVFPIIVDFPKLEILVKFLCTVNLLLNTKIILGFLNLCYRLYYGFNLRRKIYASIVPISFRGFSTIVSFLFSKNRT